MAIDHGLIAKCLGHLPAARRGREICGLIRMKEFQRAPAVLGLPSGALWTPLYEQALRLAGQAGKGGLNFGKVITFNMSELAGLGPDDEPSMNAWIRSTFGPRA